MSPGADGHLPCSHLHPHTRTAGIALSGTGARSESRTPVCCMLLSLTRTSFCPLKVSSNTERPPSSHPPPRHLLNNQLRGALPQKGLQLG